MPDIVEKLLHALADGRPWRNRAQIGKGELVLRRDPRLNLLRITLFQPAVGVGDLHPMVVIGVLDSRALRVDPRVCGAQDRNSTQDARQYAHACNSI